MTTKETADKWGCSNGWVRTRCVEGIIPLVEKKGLRWDISEDADKPPCTRHYAVNLLQLIEESQNGVDVNFFPGRNPDKVMEVYQYLSEWGFISNVDFADELEVAEKLKQSVITARGKKLMKAENPKELELSRAEQRVSVGADLGKLHASYESDKQYVAN